MKIGHGKKGTEQDAHNPKKERPCLVISKDDFNKTGGAVTVVPLTTFEPYKMTKKPVWGILITNREDVDIDQNNANYRDSTYSATKQP